MAIRQDQAQLVITIDAKESAEYQKSVQRSAELTRNLKKMEVGSKEYIATLEEQARISKKLGETDYTKLSIRNLADRRRALQEQLRILPQVTAQELGLENELKKVNQALSDNAARTRATRQVMEQTGGAMQNFRNGVASVIPGLDNFSGGLDTVKNSMKALFATPLGWILGLVAALAAGAREWYNYNESILEARKVTEDITGATGAVAQDIRSRALGIQATTGVAITESLNAAKVAVNNFGIDYNEALDVISLGLVDAGGKQQQFLESVTEYSTFFGQAGFEFSEFAGIINSGIDLGMYTDKLPDAIKEFTISVNEQTKASREALLNAFGENFTNELLDGIKDGSITAAEGLSAISQEAERVGLNTQQAAQLTADLFRGAGEDAGGALAIFEAVNGALAEEPKLLTDIQKAQMESIRLNTELERSKARALETEGFLIFKQVFVNTWKEIQITFFNFIEAVRIGLTNFVDRTKINIAIAKAEWKSLPAALQIVKNGFLNTFRNIGDAASNLWEALKNLFTFNFADAGKAFDAFKKSLTGAGDAFQASKKEAADYIANAREAARQAAEAQIAENKRVLLEQAKMEKEAQALLNTPTGGGGAGGVTDTEKDKKKKEKAKKDIKKAIPFLYDPAFYQAALQSRIDEIEKGAESELLALEEMYLQGNITAEQYELDRIRIQQENVARRIQTLDQYGLTETDQRRALNVELLKLDQELMDARVQQISDMSTEEFDALEIQFLQRLITEEEYNIRRLQLQSDFLANQLRLLEEAGLAETETYKTIKKQQLEVQKQINDEKLENEKRTQDLITQATNDGFSVAKDIIGEAGSLLAMDEKNRKKHGNAIKAFEIAKIKIDTASEIAGIWRNANSNPINALIPGWGPVFAGIQTALAAARAARNIAQISSAKYARGGSLKDGGLFSGPSHTMGGIPFSVGGQINEAEGGEIIINKRSSKIFGPVLDAINTYNGYGRRLFETGGMVRLPNTQPSGISASIINPNASTPTTAPSDPRVETLANAVSDLVRVMPMALSNIQANVSYFDIQEKGDTLNEIRRISSIN